MLSFLLLAQIAAAGSGHVDSTYATPALQRMVAAAAIANHRPPPSLRSYRSHIETEMSLMVRDTIGREHTAELEQLATSARWSRGGEYDLHVVGYRTQNIGVPYSILSFIKAWTVPTLYGDRLLLGAYGPRTRAGSDTLRVVHPFAADRDGFYRFSGGDTVAVLRAGSRRIPVTRIHVRPHFTGDTRLGAFDGEIDLDAERFQIVRMRGQFVVLGGTAGIRERIARKMGVVAVAYAEFVNAEIDGKYWLPAFQRTEFQANIPLLGQTRPVMRLVSTISGIVVDDTTTVAGASDAEGADSLHIRVTWASADSVNAFAEWRRELGAQTATVHSSDFDDIAPDAWRATGPPRVNVFPATATRMLRFNRVEGLFTGVAPSVDFRDMAPGLSASGHAGWAWAEHIMRGGGSATLRRGQDTYGVRAERALASTNDFSPPLSEDGGIAALLSSIDDYDYVDRRSAMLSLTHTFGSVSAGLATLQIGAAHDDGERARLTRGLFRGGDGFRPNRGVRSGSYALAVADVELNPNVIGEFVQPGIGARVHYEVATGDLAWQRVELRLAARRQWGQVTVASHADGGVVLGSALPPQSLFELGGGAALPGYEYKQFVGDRAALFQSFASYRFRLLERPMRAWRNFVIPGLNPGIGAGVQGGWTTLSSAAARTSAGELNPLPADSPRIDATDGVRATAGLGLTFFGDAVHLGVARPVDRVAPWKLAFGFGATF